MIWRQPISDREEAMRVYAAIGIMALFAAAASAGDISGKWVADVLTRMGGSQITTFNFKVDGTKLTGTISSRMGEREFTEGKVSGDSIFFAVVEKVRDSEQRTEYRGKLVGDELQMEYQLKMPPGGMGGFIPPPPMEFTAKRVK
jgi:hypothetical protein